MARSTLVVYTLMNVDRPGYCAALSERLVYYSDVDDDEEAAKQAAERRANILSRKLGITVLVQHLPDEDDGPSEYSDDFSWHTEKLLDRDGF